VAVAERGSGSTNPILISHNKRRRKMTFETELTRSMIELQQSQFTADVVKQNAELQNQLHLVMQRLLDIVDKAVTLETSRT
jgi:hypothetical protein